MKLVVLVEVDVSKTIAETIQRTGFEIKSDGSGMQIKVPNSPAVPQRKTRVTFVENATKDQIDTFVKSLTEVTES